MHASKHALVWSLATSLALAGMPHLVQAEVIGTAEVAAAEGHAPQATDARARIGAALARADVADALRERGVDPAAIQARVDALTDDEALALAQRIDSAPAGADGVLGTIVFLFVLLLVTDILGFTKVFPFTRSVR